MSLKLLQLAEVAARTCLSKSTIYELIRKGSFPKSVPLTARNRGWLEHEIDAWIEARAAVRDTEIPRGQRRREFEESRAAVEA